MRRTTLGRILRHRAVTSRGWLPLAVVVTAGTTVLVLAATLLLHDRSGFPGSVAPDNAARAAGGTRTCAGQAIRAPREVRGLWITTVNNSDWPSRPGLPADVVKSEFRQWLDLAKRLRFNAVFVQVRPAGDAFWPSRYVPWSQWITGQVAGAGPGWDPMGFAVAEAHRSGLEFHAWFNPYRASRVAADQALFPADHPLARHPDWGVVFPANDSARLYYNPGVPDARRYVEDSILEAVTSYDLDGVHFDDFFYPYPVRGAEFPDDATFAAYGEGFASKADWRRANVNQLIKETGKRVKEVKPWVRFGISPFGIWRNASTDPLGSDTAGLQSYDDIYADSRHWVHKEWIDYIVPQLYWNIGFKIADYAKLVPWWSEVVKGTKVQLYIGQGDYRVGSAGAWSDPAELDRQLALNKRYPVRGSVHFTAHDVRADRLGSVSRYVEAHHPTAALVPVLPGQPRAAPGTPGPPRSARGPRTVTVTWRSGPAPAAARFAVYRVATPVDGSSPASGALVWIGAATGADDQEWVDSEVDRATRYAYCVTALDRLGNESAASPASDFG